MSVFNIGHKFYVYKVCFCVYGSSAESGDICKRYSEMDSGEVEGDYTIV